MSKNFELLQRAEQMGALFPIPATAVRPSNVEWAPSVMDPDAIARDEAVKLVHRVFYAQGRAGMRTIVFAAVGNSKACARVCSATGEALAAQASGTVCVMDADLRSPFVHEYFKMDNFPGLADAMVRSENIKQMAIQTARSNLWVIPCGTRAANLPALLTSEQMTQRITELRREFDYVLISAPPADLFAEAATLGRMADGVILVVEAEFSLREAALKAKQALEAADVRLLGAVLNNRTFPIPQQLYKKLR